MQKWIPKYHFDRLIVILVLNSFSSNKMSNLEISSTKSSNLLKRLILDLHESILWHHRIMTATLWRIVCPQYFNIHNLQNHSRILMTKLYRREGTRGVVDRGNARVHLHRRCQYLRRASGSCRRHGIAFVAREMHYWRGNETLCVPIPRRSQHSLNTEKEFAFSALNDVECRHIWQIMTSEWGIRKIRLMIHVESFTDLCFDYVSTYKKVYPVIALWVMCPGRFFRRLQFFKRSALILRNITFITKLFCNLSCAKVI